jgi:pyruvate dehydrogenase E1 component beta subunit/2-oxoisovalerate dehydrogenase E1 component
MAGEIDAAAGPVDISRAAIRRAGQDLTLITYGGSLWKTLAAAEVSARIMEQAFWSLDAPVGRVCSAEVPIPYPKHLEEAAIPQVPAIVAAARGVMGR